MAANQRTLVRDGVGVVLVPAAANERDDEWLRVANPLPVSSEAALRDVVDAVRSRTSLSSSAAEDEAALRALRAGDHFEARERAARWIFGYVANPDNRHARAPLDAQLEVFEQATRGVERERRILMATGRRFGAFVQGGFHRVKENLPQNTLLILDGSNSVSFAAGVRMGLFWPSEGGGWPVWRDLHLRGTYGYARHTFNGPPAQQQDGSEPRMRTRAHRISGELVYRPRVLSRIRPHFRGGPAGFYITASAYDTEDRLRERVQRWEFGWVLGAGMDAWSSRSRNVRLTATFDYQIVSTQFCEAEAPAWDDATNFIELPPEENRPQSLRCLQFSRSTLAYEVDLEGFQAGLALSYDF